MTIAVTGVTGHLGRLVLDALLDRTDAADLVAVVRNAEKAADLAARGVQVRVADYTDPTALRSALQGVDKLLLVSSSEVGQRFVQHRNVIEAAQSAGVGHVVYTSLTNARGSSNPLAPEHRQTEELLESSGLTHTVLRNNWYHENYEAQLDTYRETGVLLAAAGDGKVGSASRRDFAEAAAVVLTSEGHEGQVYELTGDVAWTYDELAAALSQALGREVTHQRTDVAGLVEVLRQAGLDEGTAGFVAALDGAIAEGTLDLVDPALERLLGRSPRPLVDVLTDSAS